MSEAANGDNAFGVAHFVVTAVAITLEVAFIFGKALVDYFAASVIAVFKKDESPNKPNFVTTSQLLRAELEEQRKKAALELQSKEEEIRKAREIAGNLAAQDARDAIKAAVIFELLNSELQKANEELTKVTAEYNTYTYGSSWLPAGLAVYAKQQAAILAIKDLQEKFEQAKRNTVEKSAIAEKSMASLPADWNPDLERESIMKALSENTSTSLSIPTAQPIAVIK